MPDSTKPEISFVWISDLHAGSQSAVCLPDNPKRLGGSHKASPAQIALYEAYASLADEWKKPDILGVCGDAMEGKARKDSGVPCWSTDFSDQIACAEKLINLFGAKETYIINGTGYHVDAEGVPLENTLARNIGAKKIGAGKGEISDEELFLKVAGTTFHAAHHISTGTGWYRSTPMARELVFALLNESHKHRVDVVLRGHVHYFCGVEFERQKGYTLPCWQLQTRYMKKKSALGMVPSIGALRFRIRPDGLRVDKSFFKLSEAKPRLLVYEESPV